MNPTTEVHKRGQSLLLDNITRDLLERDFPVSRFTSNSTIFDHAVRNTNLYDHAIRDATARGQSGRSMPLTYGGFRNGLGRSVDYDQCGGAARPVIYCSRTASTDCAQQLSAILRHVGASRVANHCFWQTDAHAAMARATKTIAGWLTYLPAPCVRAMVNAGWHWST